MKQMTAKQREKLQLQCDEYALLTKNMQELKDARELLRPTIISAFMKHGITSMALFGGGFLVHTKGSNKAFFGGFKKFAKEFGADVARKWFKDRDYDSLTVEKKGIKRRTSRKSKG